MKTPSLTRKISIIAAASSLVIGLHASPLLAEPIYHPSGPRLTFGGMTHRQMTVSDMGNPAHPAGIPYPEGGKSIYGGGLSVGIGIEYDGNDNLFQLLDQASDSGASPGGGGSGGGDGADGDTDIPITLPPLDPEVQAKLGALVREVAAAAAFIGLAVTETNAKAFISADVPLLTSNNALGGTWTFGANTSITTSLKGLNDPINFDIDAATQQLLDAYKAAPATPTTYDLTGGASVTINPDGSTKFRIENNSGVITRAAQITEISIGYSRQVWKKDEDRVLAGIRPKYFNVGLSNSAVPIADIQNARDVFKALDKSSFSYSQDFALDLGAIWRGKQYQLGATVTNLNEPDFNYPAADLSGFTNPVIIQAIRNSERYVMERQLKLDAGYITPGGAWGINFGLDVNPVPDPMGDDYQWLSVGGGFASDSWWLPGARIGLRKNMAGTELTHVTAGITVFNILNLDLASSTRIIKINGKTVPQGLILNIGAQVVF